MPINSYALDDMRYDRRSIILSNARNSKKSRFSCRLVPLFFPIETKPLKTSFRVEALNFIHEVARQELGNKIDSVDLQVNTDPYDLEHIGLLLSIWAKIGKCEWIEADRAISNAVFQQKKYWTEAEQNDYMNMIDFEILPLKI